jgi:tripartite-type tricarboxylate transporter receptor subunit TctC
MVLVVNTKSSFQSLAQFIQTTREPQSQLSFGGTGPNTTQHLAFEAFKAATSADLRFVSFGGDPSAVSNVLGGHITAALVNYAAVKDQLGPALRPLAVGTRERLAELPDVPSFAELGFSQVEAAAWMGLVVPAKTPADTTTLITDLVRSSLDLPQIKGKLKALGVLPSGLCALDFATFLSREHERYGRIVKAANIEAK